MSSFQPGVPTGRINLDEDYQNIQNNFQQLDTSFGVDHTLFSVDTAVQPAGYHKGAHFIPFSTTTTNPPNNSPPTQPATTAGFGQLWSAEVNDGVNIDQSLYYLTGGGINTPITRNFLPVAGNNGYTFIPGGLIVQWGFVNGTHGGDNHFNSNDTGTVNFNTANIDFPTSCFGIWTQPLFTNGNPPASGNTFTAAINNNFTNTSFTWYILTSSGSYTRFFWWAIGI